MIREIARLGGQHIFFFKAPGNYGDDWATEQKVIRQLQMTGYDSLYNTNPKWFIPSHTTIESVCFKHPVLIVTVVIPSFWNERDKSLDTREGNRFTVGYKVKSSRSVATFEWNVVTGQAFLAIPQGEKRNYSAEKDTLISLISHLIKLRSFQLCNLREAIAQTMQEEGTIIRSLGIETETQEHLTIRSRSKNNDVFENPVVAAVYDSLEGSMESDGNFYLPRQADQSKKFRCRMHPDHRLSLYSQLNEKEVRYVIANVHKTV